MGNVRGVVVLGMHRSGTSVATGLINLHGVPICRPEDRFVDVPWAPSGLWESRSISNFNDHLLAELGGRWWAPPRLSEGWAESSRLGPWRDEARRLFCAAHPGPQWTWKDPRACVLLPFWESAMGIAQAHVLLLRHPAEVAASLFARNRMAAPLALALAERHIRSAFLSAMARSVLVVAFDDLTSDPPGWARLVVRYLAGRGFDITEPSSHQVSAFVDRNLRHHASARTDLSNAMSAEQRALWAWSSEQVGIHDHLEIRGLPAESRETEGRLAGERLRAIARYKLTRPSDNVGSLTG